MRRIALLALIGCGGQEPAADALSFEQVHGHLALCASCHAGDYPDGDLDLSGDMYRALLDTPSKQSDLPLVEPFDSRYSYLWHKLGGTQGLAGGSGTRMPLGEALSDEAIERIAQWIDEGAAP